MNPGNRARLVFPEPQHFNGQAKNIKEIAQLGLALDKITSKKPTMLRFSSAMLLHEQINTKIERITLEDSSGEAVGAACEMRNALVEKSSSHYGQEFLEEMGKRAGFFLGKAGNLAGIFNITVKLTPVYLLYNIFMSILTGANSIDSAFELALASILATNVAQRELERFGTICAESLSRFEKHVKREQSLQPEA